MTRRKCLWPTVAGADPAGKVRGGGGDFKNITCLSVILSLTFISELHKIMVNKHNFDGFRGSIAPIAPSLDPHLRIRETCCVL